MPVPITVEGANILTRSMIIFGQGAIRCHPYLLKEMQAAQNPDRERALEEFDKALFGHFGFTFANFSRAFWHNLSGGRLAAAPGNVSAELQDYYRQLSRVSASFALVADTTMMLLGGELKRREKLSARLGDVLSDLYLLSCVLKRYEDDGRQTDDLPLVHWNVQQGLYRIQQALDDILANFPSKPMGWLLRRVVFPWGRRWQKASDRLGHQVARLLLKPSAARDRLTADMFVSYDPDDVTGILEYALEKVLAAEPIEAKLAQAKHDGSLDEAVDAGLLSAAEAELLREAERATHKVIMVDDFAPEELSPRAVRPQAEAVETEELRAAS